MTMKVNIVKCKNCGNYFVSKGRSDMVYCSYPLMGHKDKTCRNVGAQITRANKEKSDDITREYRKIYVRYKMAISRHPDDVELVEKFERLTNEFKQRRKDVVNGESTNEKLLKWLEAEF